jgi:bacteriocin biosynthesis cyclodehydratase domain-containing protein
VIPDVPELPLLAPWYRVVEEGERIVFEHASRAVVLEGAAVRALLPRLLPLLDGTRSLAELVAAVGAPAEAAVTKAVSLLAERGLLTAGPRAAAAAGETRAAAEQLAAGGLVSPAAAAAALERARVGIAGESAVALELAGLLARSGVRRLERLRCGPLERRYDVVVAAPAADELRLLVPLNESALEAEQPWLQVLPFDGRIVPVGPLFLPGETGCHACYLLRRSAALGFAAIDPLLDREPTRAPAGPALEALAAGAAASILLRWLALADPQIPGVLFAVEPASGLVAGRHLVLRVPRCSACSLAERVAPAAPWYEPDRAVA